MSPPLHREATPALLRQLAHDGHLDASRPQKALALVGARADAAAWRRFTERTPLFAGVGLVLAGIVYFFAANWEALTRAHRLGLALAALLIAAIGAAWIGLERLGGKVAAVAAALLVGPVLLTFGQAYQTGADAWELFAGWALLALPFAVAVRGPTVFIIVLVLLRVTVVLALDQVWGIDIEKAGAIPAVIAVMVVDVAATIIATARGALASARLFAALGALTLALPLIFVTTGVSRAGDALGFALFAVAAAAHFGAIAWGLSRRDAPLVAIAGASSALHIGVIAARVIFADLRGGEGGFLIMGLFVLGEAALLAALLREARR